MPPEDNYNEKYEISVSKYSELYDYGNSDIREYMRNRQESRQVHTILPNG